MMKRHVLFFIVWLFGALFFISGMGCKGERQEGAEEKGVPSAEDTRAVPDTGDVTKEMIIVSSLFKTHTKGEVRFTHERHAKEYRIACTECHHVYKDGENVWQQGMPVEKCQDCHDEATVRGEKTLAPDVQKRNLKLAFHENCVTCHRDVKKENPDTTAPTTCTKCHKRQ
jgi:hypothetical protein